MAMVLKKSVEDISVSGKRVIVRVDFERVRRSSIGEPPGRDTRFVTLGRQEAGGQWFVLSYGTGP